MNDVAGSSWRNRSRAFLIEHKANGNAVAEIAGEGAVTSTLASGDVESLQRTIIEKQHDQMVELVLAGESLTDES